MPFTHDIPADKLSIGIIEGTVERMTNTYDRDYMNNTITTEQYDALLKDLEVWSDEQYTRLRGMPRFIVRNGQIIPTFFD